MINLFFQYQFWLGLVIGLLVLRQALLLVAAEQGRKHDLARPRFKPSEEFHLSVLIPFLNPDDHPSLLTLLHALHEQDYPAGKVTVHLVVSPETAEDLIPQALQPNVKIWQYPKPTPRYEHSITWLIERCLAAGGNSMFVFLKPTDIVKPDFFQNIAMRGLDSFAVQGYVALKNNPDTPLSKVRALAGRLFNRLGNAGRYHLGLSCRLLDSGWAIKQEVLEMIPYHRGIDLDNVEYTMRLNLENFRVNWAPGVVVYGESNVHFLAFLTQGVGAFFNRINLLLRYGPRLLTRMILRFDLSYLDHVVSLFQPPLLFVALLFGLLAFADERSALPIPAEPMFWGVAALVVLALNIVGMVVARSRSVDYATLFFYTPIVYVLGLIASPVALASYLGTIFSLKPKHKGPRYRAASKTRFNESMETLPDLFDEAAGQDVIRNILKKNAPALEKESPEDFSGFTHPARRPKSATQQTITTDPITPSSTATRPKSRRLQTPRETVKSIPLSNGKKQVNCMLRIQTEFLDDGAETYQLTLEYKSLSFSTESYRILDQAFYELQSKLMGRGLTIVTCGSCGYFYNPTADVPGALNNAGVCLFGKTGKEVSLSTDAVTVVSQACPYHCPLAEREGIVRQWKDSLALSRSTK